MAQLAPFGLSTSQRAMAATIEEEFTRAGYSLPVAAAAIVNAYAESGLDSMVIGDQGRSVGLFQLNIKGAGKGLTVAQRQDPKTNVRTLVAREKKALAKVQAAANQGSSVPSLTGLFCSLVERPSNKTEKATYRAALSFRLFPVGIDVPAAAPAASASPSNAPLVSGSSPETPRTVSTRTWVAVAGLAGIALILGWGLVRTYKPGVTAASRLDSLSPVPA